MPIVYLALGSNIGDSISYIKQAIELIGGKARKVQKAPIYRSRAIGYSDQPDFLNTVIRGQTYLKPEALLKFTNEVERKVGRVRRFPLGPREIDIDIILYDELMQETSKLTLPHPRFRERDFVLQPLCDLDANLTDPVSKQTVAQLLANLDLTKRSILEKVDEKA